MIKKYSVLAATLVVASSGSSFASSQKNPHQGVSIGLQGGYDVFKHEHKDRNGDKLSANPKGGFFGGFLGYGMMINSGLYTGLEVFGNIQGAKCTETSGGDKTKDTLSVKDSFGALVKLGYVFKSANNLLTYISLGAVNSKFKAESTGGRKNISLSKRKTGFLLGLNADIPIGKNFFIRAGLSHTWYGKVTYRLDNGTDVGHDSKAFQALAGVGYRF